MLYRISQWVLDLGIPVSSDHLSLNFCEGAIQYLEQNPKYVVLHNIIENPYAVKIIQKNLHRIDRSLLFLNPNVLEIVDYDKLTIRGINWFHMSKQPVIFSERFQSLYKEDIFEEVYYKVLSCNRSYEAIDYLENNPQIIYWDWLSENPYAIDILLKNQDRINWGSFNKNPHPKAVELIIEQNKIIWETFLTNPTAIEIIKRNKDMITSAIWENPEIFEIDYEAMAKQRMDLLREELMMKTLHPSRIEKWLEAGLSIDDL
jgi:hypothetical protein